MGSFLGQPPTQETGDKPACLAKRFKVCKVQVMAYLSCHYGVSAVGFGQSLDRVCTNDARRAVTTSQLWNAVRSTCTRLNHNSFTESG